MKRQELIVLLMLAEGRGDDLFQVFNRELLRQWVQSLIEKGMVNVVAVNFVEPRDVLNGSLAVTDKARIFLEALDTVPLPSPAWSMNQIAGE